MAVHRPRPPEHPTAMTMPVARKYAMLAGLWLRGIYSFFELLHNRLLDSLDHIASLHYLDYSMMTLLFETIPAFGKRWIQYLGDLGQSRMAIEDDDIRDRELWTQILRQRYSKASDRTPRVERLCHHLAILARPNALH